MRETENYIFFWGTWFSHWAMGKFIVDGVEYNCAEQYMMAEKARVFGDKESLAKILKAKSPKEQKALGRRVKKYDDKVWSEKRFEIVKKANLAKFSQIPAAANFMKNSKGKKLVEASPYDKIWGIGLHYSDDRVLDEKKWKGQNLLGKVLMEVRQDLFGEKHE